MFEAVVDWLPYLFSSPGGRLSSLLFFFFFVARHRKTHWSKTDTWLLLQVESTVASASVLRHDARTPFIVAWDADQTKSVPASGTCTTQQFRFTDNSFVLRIFYKLSVMGLKNP